jgi:hypothetical protein
LVSSGIQAVEKKQLSADRNARHLAREVGSGSITPCVPQLLAHDRCDAVVLFA